MLAAVCFEYDDLLRSDLLGRSTIVSAKGGVVTFTTNYWLYVGQFAQFVIRRGQTHFSQLHISLDSDELES